MLIENKHVESEVDTLQKMITALNNKNHVLSIQNTDLLIKNAKISDQNKELLNQINILEEQLSLLRARKFGRASEKIERQIDLVERTLEEQESILGFKSKSNYISEVRSENSGQAKRKKLPEHLPREEIIIAPDSKCSSCGGERFRTIG